MTQTIEQLTARVRELEEENARLIGRPIPLSTWQKMEQQLAASQLYAEQLRNALDVVSISPLVNDCGLPKYGVSVSEMKLVHKALNLPRDTSACAAYVAEKVKEAVSTQKEYYESVFHDGAKRIATLTRQRDLAVEAMRESLECGEGGDWQSARRVLDSAIKESEV